MSATQETIRFLNTIETRKLRPLFDRHGVPTSERGSIAALMDEIRLDGGNTLVNWFRWNEGVEYDEIIKDVAEQMKLKPAQSWRVNEKNILKKIIEEIVARMDEDEREQIQQILEKSGKTFKDKALGARVGGKVVAAALSNTIARKAIMEAVKRALMRMAGKEAAKRAGAYLIPGLNVLMAAWTVFDVAGPAYRKTIPTVIEIALLRLEYTN